MVWINYTHHNVKPKHPAGEMVFGGAQCACGLCHGFSDGVYAKAEQAIKDGHEKYDTHFKNQAWGSKGFMTLDDCLVEAVAKLLEA